MRVLLIGAGRYGNGLIGKKYAAGKFGTKLAGVVDPRIDEIKQMPNFYLKNFPLYHSIDEVSEECIRNSVLDIALIPQIVSEVYEKAAKKGAKMVILPKPITTNEEDFNLMDNITETENISAVVASNWHYSNITNLLKNILNYLTKNEPANTEALPPKLNTALKKIGSGFSIVKTKIEYNKKNEVLSIDPPLQELPHAMQIAYSSGITNLEGVKIIMDKCLQSKSRVNAKILNGNDLNSVILNSDLQMLDNLDKKRERIVKVYLARENELSIITADFDADFDTLGNCIKQPSITYTSPNSFFKFKITEDNMDIMYKSMFETLQRKKGNALTLHEYKPIANCIFYINKLWNNITQKTKACI